MTLPAAKLSKPTVSLASSNYISNDVESLNTLRVSAKTKFGTTLSTDFGADFNFEKIDNKITTTIKPAFEAKIKQNIASIPMSETSVNFRTYARYRHIGNANQLRIAAGASVPLNDKLSVYADAHYTTKFQEGKDKIGIWAGFDYDMSKKDHWGLDVGQANYNPSTGKWDFMTNIFYRHDL